MKGIRAQLFDVMSVTIRVSKDLKIVLSCLGVQDDQYQLRACGTSIVQEEHADVMVKVSDWSLLTHIFKSYMNWW